MKKEFLLEAKEKKNQEEISTLHLHQNVRLRMPSQKSCKWHKKRFSLTEKWHWVDLTHKREMTMSDSVMSAGLCSSLFSDGLDDPTELDDRISYLEKKVSLQDDEIQCLKSALADALRRLSIVETQNHRWVLEIGRDRIQWTYVAIICVTSPFSLDSTVVLNDTSLFSNSSSKVKGLCC